MADATKVINFRPLPKPIVRWAFSSDLQAWIASGSGKSIAAVVIDGDVYRRLDERAIYASLFRGVR
jgi:hypothetical protein